MQVSVEICVIPMGVAASVSPYVAACVRELEQLGFKPQLHAFGTNIEGEWDAVFGAVRRCHEIVHAMGAPRIITSLKSVRARTRCKACRTSWKACIGNSRVEWISSRTSTTRSNWRAIWPANRRR